MARNEQREGIQLALFETVDDPAVAPAQRPQDEGKSRYRRLTGTIAGLCDDCILALYQAHWRGPAPLRAVYEQRSGNAKLRLCQIHYNRAREQEAAG